MNFDELSRISFVVFTANNTGEKPVINLVPSLSISRTEVEEIGDLKQKGKIENIPLPRFWNRIGRNQFCLPDGSVINSKATVSQYYTAARPYYTPELEQLADKVPGPTYTICYKETTRVPNAKKAGDVPLDLALHTFENKTQDFSALPNASAIDSNAIAGAPSNPGSRPGTMTVNDWNEVLVGNNLLKGFVVDTVSQSISKARKTAFKLLPNPIHPLMFSPGTVTSAEIEEIKEKAKAAVEMSPVVKVELGLQTALSGDLSKLGDDTEPPAPPANEPLEHLFPLWEVCDDSCVKIETISTKLQLASAQQGFSSASVEAAVATSVVALVPIAAEASAGFATKSSSAGASQTGTKSEQMHATYEFPRVRMYLDEESITISSDCEAAIRNIEQTKSHKDIQNFYRTYGQLFVTRVKLGGRLRATRLLSASEASSMDSTQNAWKASLAASFSTATTSGSVKGAAAAGSSNEHKTASSSLEESVCWEAHGGNTTLANNPSAWCSTVENFWYWRIVEQEVIVPIEDVISTMKGFEQTRALFAGIIVDSLFQATPMEILWNGGEGATLGRGMCATSVINQPNDVLRESPLKAGDTNIVDVPVEPPSEWSVITNNKDLYGFLKGTFKQTINPFVGTKLFPSLVWRLGLGERAFSVVMTIRIGLKKSTTTFTVDGTQHDDPQQWKDKYGDYYINSTVSGTRMSVCWTFISQTASQELLKTRKAVANFFASPPAAFEVGCAYMARLAADFPCEAYLYDAYYNEKKLPSPSNVLSEIARRRLHDPPQLLSVGLEPYLDLDGLQQLASLTAPTAVSPAALETIRNDHVEFAFQSAKRQHDLAIIDTGDSQWANWSSDFSSNAYAEGQNDPDGQHGAATGLAKDYQSLFTRSTSTVEPRMTSWPEKHGDQETLERRLRWLRLSRQAEAKALFSQQKAKGITTFGFVTEPAATEAELTTRQTHGEIKLYSLRDELKLLGLENIMAINGKGVGSLDSMWSYVIDEANLSKMTYPGPGRVIAYELTTTWDGNGTAPPMVSTGQVQSKVGEKLTTFAKGRMGTTTDEWMLTNLWIVYAPFKWSDIDSEVVPQ